MNTLSDNFDRIIDEADRITTIITVVAVTVLVLYAFIKYRREIAKLFPKDIKLRFSGKETGIIFGKKGPFIACSPEEDEGHVIDYAGSGLGKTRTQVLQTLNNWKGTTLCIDLAGDIIPNTPNTNRYVYTPWDVFSIPYNVFYKVDFAKDADEQFDELDEVVEALMPQKIFDSETTEFFYKMGKKILTASFYTFYFQGKDFVEICRIIRKSNWTELSCKIRESRNEKAIAIIGDIADMKESTIGSGKDKANDAIMLFADKRIFDSTLRRPDPGENYLSPETLETSSIYVNITEKYNVLYGSLMQLISNQCLKYVMMRDNYYGPNILLCLDEYSSLGYVDLLRPLDKFRKKRCRIYIHVQSILQLDDMYSVTRREIMMENFKFQIIMGSNVPRVQKLFADIIGHKTFDKDAYKEDPENLSNLGKYIYVKCPGGSMKIRKKFKLSKKIG